jgi:hypothetical protein
MTAGNKNVAIRVLNDERVNALKSNNKLFNFYVRKSYAPLLSIVRGSIVTSPFSCICKLSHLRTRKRRRRLPGVAP